MTAGAAPFDLRTDFGGDAFTVTSATPRLSWRPAGDGSAERFEIEVIVDDEHLGARIAESHIGVPWPWAALRSQQRVRWRVREESGAWSAWSVFEAGLFEEDWTASWIAPVVSEDPGQGRRPAHLLNVAFPVAGEVRTARLYSTALGVYTATINGQRVGTAELLPGSTSYDRTLYAQASDVTTQLRAGGNELAVELSDGWYRGQVGAFRLPAGWGDGVALRAELHIEFADGSDHIVRTGEGWSSRRSATTRADLMEGQTTDFSAPVDAAQPVIVGGVSAPPVDYSPSPPVRVVERRRPETIERIGDDRWIVDFGQNASGWVRLEGLGPRGTRTVIEYGEHLGADGDLSTRHLDSHKPGEPTVVFSQRDEVVSGGSGEVFAPRHTVHGFQYARITRAGVPLADDAIEMHVVHSDLERTGSFQCSDEDLNRLHRIADWSFRGNAVDVPTDCPTRERLAWSGDYQVFISTATRLYDVLGFSRKWLRSVRDDQLDDGRITNFSPDGRRIKLHLDDQFAMMTGSAGWGDAIIAVPWELYRTYGDVEVLVENWTAMRGWVEWALSKAASERHHARVQRSSEPEAHERYLWDGTFHWGEWCEPKERDADGNRIDPVQSNPMAWFMADKGEVGTAFLYRSTATLSRIAGLLGHHDDEARYAALAERIRDAWQAAYLGDDGTTSVDSQASYVRALSFGLVPEQLRAAAADRLVERIRDAGTQLRTGFLSTGDLLPVLADAGHADVAYELLLQREEPSWLAMLDRGATTVWEGWEGIDEHGDAHDSLNHYSKGAVIRFLHTHSLGLRQEEGTAGWRSIVIAPVPGGALTWAEGSFVTPNGTVSVRWTVGDGTLRLDADIPVGTNARILLPDGTEQRVSAGRHRAECAAPHFAAQLQTTR